MQALNQNIEDHYYKSDLFEDILERLRSQGIDLDEVKRTDIAGTDEFHVRGATVSKELAESVDLKGASVLDVGCGLGGPCRMLADEYGCTAVGIDLSHEYIRTAGKLSSLVKMGDQTTFLQGDATDLPFDNASFDVVWTQHVQMNIPDKKKLYAEINRVLKPGGHFLYYDIFKKSDETVHYPMPWASNETLSFLSKTSEMAQILKDLELVKIASTDQSQAGIDFFDALVARLKEFGPPKIGLNVLMGETTKPKIGNLLSHLKSDILMLESGIYKKQ